MHNQACRLVKHRKCAVRTPPLQPVQSPCVPQADPSQQWLRATGVDEALVLSALANAIRGLAALFERAAAIRGRLGRVHFLLRR